MTNATDLGPVPVSALGGAHTLTPREERDVLRSIAGEPLDDPRPQTFRDFACAARKSDADGIPVLGGSKWMGLDESLVRGTGTAHDPLDYRYRIIRLPQILDRVAARIETTRTGSRRVANGLDGVAQVRIALWFFCGIPSTRDIHAGARLDDADRAAIRRAKRSGRKTMKPPRRKPYLVREDVPATAGVIADKAREEFGGIIAARGVVACAEEVAALAFLEAPTGWLLPPRRVEMTTTNEGSESMATADYIDGWGEIAKYLRISIRTAQALQREGLPVRNGLSRGVCARRDELDAWQDKRRALRASVWNAGERDDCAPLRDSASPAR